MGSGWGLGDDWASPRLRWNRATEHNPGLQCSKQSQTHPSDFISIETFDLGHHTLSILAAQQLYTYIWDRRTDGLRNSPFRSFSEIDAAMRASGQISSNLLVFNLQLPHTTSNLFVYNLQLSYMFVQPVSVYLFEVLI